jgi:hypothetical protein
MQQLVYQRPIPKPGQKLMRKIVAACKGQDSDLVVNALFNVLIQAIEQWEDCDAASAAEYIRNAAEQTMVLDMEEVGHA